MADNKKKSKFSEPVFDKQSMDNARDALKKGTIKIKTDEIKLKKK